MRLAVLALSLSLAVPALADTTVPIYGTLTDGGTASGTLTIDTSVVPAAMNSNGDLVTGLDFGVDDNGTDYTFDSINYQGVQQNMDGTYEYYLDAFSTTGGGILFIGLPLSEVAALGTDSASFCTANSGCYYSSGVNQSAFASIGAAPEPSSLILLGTGLLGVVGAARRRFVLA